MTVVNTVQNMDWRELARRVRDEVGQVDALIVDAPYSAVTHSGHDAVPDAERREQLKRHGRHGGKQASGGGNRRAIPYAAWTQSDVASFVAEWATLTNGWIVTITDSVLAPCWAAEMELAGRYVFAPLPYVHVGGRVRLSGDGPSSWTCWIVVARPRSQRFARWGTLPGAYVLSRPTGRLDIPGGKALWLMEALVRDYSEPGDLIADPCCGGGTTLLAAKLLGRRYVGSDIDAEHVEIARERLRANPTKPKAGTLALPWETE